MEMSERACFEGATWGTRSIGVVWVDRGCRATFSVGSIPQPRKRKLRVVCESQKGQREVCPAETESGITFARQLSQTECVRGENWGWDDDRGMVWVDHGCRAEFLIGRNSESPPATQKLDTVVVCESENNKRKDCKADTGGGVQIVRALSDAPCGFEHEWGYDANGIWVNKGCRAEFVVRSQPKVMARSVTCESQNDARHHCAAETQFGVALVRQLGEKECVLDQSWGFDEQGVWVAGGCRAQFALGGYRLPPNAVPPTAAKVMCESLDGGHKQCPVDTSRGVGLIRQTSGADCVLNKTWGYDRNGIRVTNGCRAEFAVAR
jgi:hypothetical protein